MQKEDLGYRKSGKILLILYTFLYKAIFMLSTGGAKTCDSGTILCRYFSFITQPFFQGTQVVSLRAWGEGVTLETGVM